MQSRVFEGKELKYLHNSVMNILTIAHIHGGRCFGGYVRDVFPKVLVQDFSAVDVKDLDLWFQSKDDKDDFIASANSYLKAGYRVPSSANPTLQVETYQLKDAFGEPLIWLDLVVSESFPVNDFDVNMLSWNFTSQTFESHSTESTSAILDKIRLKRANVSSYYYNLLASDNKNSIQRLYRRYLAKGWRVFFDDKELFVRCDGKAVTDSNLDHTACRRLELLLINSLEYEWYKLGYTRKELRGMLTDNNYTKVDRIRTELNEFKHKMTANSTEIYSEDIALFDKLLELKPQEINFKLLDSLIQDVDAGKVTATLAFGAQEALLREQLDKIEDELELLKIALNMLSKEKPKVILIHSLQEPDSEFALRAKVYQLMKGISDGNRGAIEARNELNDTFLNLLTSPSLSNDFKHLVLKLLSM